MTGRSESPQQRNLCGEQFKGGGMPVASQNKLNVFSLVTVMNFASIRPLGCDKESPSTTSIWAEGFS